MSITCVEIHFIDCIKKIARKYKKWILIILVKDKNIRNRSLINSKGKIENYYDKINMFELNYLGKKIHQENKIFKAGNKLKVVKLPWGKNGFKHML